MECPICLGLLSRESDGIQDPVRRRLVKIKNATCVCTPCGHIFHKDCLLVWMDERSTRPTCPVCMDKLSKLKLYPAYMRDDRERVTALANAANNREPAAANSVAVGPSGTNQPAANAIRTAAILPMTHAGNGINAQRSGGSGGRLNSIPAAARGANALPSHIHPLGNIPFGLGLPGAFVPFHQSPSIGAPIPIPVALPSTSSRGVRHVGAAVLPPLPLPFPPGLMLHPPTTSTDNNQRVGWGPWDFLRTPYQQPPPAHTASSLPALARITDLLNSAGTVFNVPNTNTGNGNFTADAGPRNRATSRQPLAGGGLAGTHQINADLSPINQILFDYLSEP